jgi:hypothetical protein
MKWQKGYSCAAFGGYHHRSIPSVESPRGGRGDGEVPIHMGHTLVIRLYVYTYVRRGLKDMSGIHH